MKKKNRSRKPVQGEWKHRSNRRDCESSEITQKGPKTNYENVALQYEFFRSFWKDYFDCWTYYADIAKNQQCPPKPVDNRVSYSSQGPKHSTHGLPKPVPESPPSKYSFDEFQYFVVIDFEATCDEVKIPRPQEMIEFPSVIVNSRTGQLEDNFQVYVRPTHNQLLSKFCKDLTGIQQSQVDKGVPLDEALILHDKWLENKGVKHTNFAIVTWTNWDCQVLLESECQFKRIKKPSYFNRWINLKILFNETYGVTRCNLKEAIDLAGFKWEGRAHCGLDDAKNTARLVTHLMIRGTKLKITNTLKKCTSRRNEPHLTADTLLVHHEHGPSARNQPHIMVRGPKQSITNTPLRNPNQGASAVKEQPHLGPKQPITNAPLRNPNQGPSAVKERPHQKCYCEVVSKKHVLQLATGQKKDGFFLGCGNYTARGPICNFFKWVFESDGVKAGP